MGFDHPILADHAWGSQSGRQQTVKQSVFFLNFGFKRSSRASNALPSLALRFIV